MEKIVARREAVRFSSLCLVLCAVVAAGQTPKNSPSYPGHPPPAALSPQEIFKRVSPSVVVVESLDSKGSVTAFGSGVVICGGCGSGNPPKRLPADSLETRHIVTNRHVVEGGVTFDVEHNGRTWPAKLVRVDSDHDLAELSVLGLTAPSVRVRDSSTLAVGEKVYAIGAPEGLELTISEGLISGLRDFDKDRVIQTSAAISHGSSGGGLFDAEGRLVGITTFYLKEGQSLNFALPAEWTLALDRQPANAAPTWGSQDSPAFQALLWFEAGYKADEAGKSGQAVSAYREAIRLEPGNAPAWNNLGIAYENLGQYDQAVSAEQQAIRLEPDLEEAWVNLGNCYGYLGQYDQEANAEQEAIRLKPGDAKPWHNLGSAYYILGQDAQAVSAERQAIRLKPDFEEAWVTLGAAYDDLWEAAEAVSAEQEAIRLKPGDAKAWHNLGAAYDELGQDKQEISALREAIRLKPDDADLWFDLGWAYKQQGQSSEVIRIYERLKPLDPKLAEVFFQEVVLPQEDPERPRK